MMPRYINCFNLAFLVATAVVITSVASAAETAHPDDDNIISHSTTNNRKNCQIIFVIGAEGPRHHKFTPIIEELASQQVDPTTGTQYQIVSHFDGTTLRSVLLTRSMLVGMLLRSSGGNHDPEQLAKRAISRVCPDDGTKHVIIEDFNEDDEDERHQLSSNLRTLRRMGKSTYLEEFHKFYSPHADIRYVVLSSPLIDMVASHDDWKDLLPYYDNIVERHSLAVRDTLELLHKFLGTSPGIEGEETSATTTTTDGKLWTLVCLEQLMPNFHDGYPDTGQNNSMLTLARATVLSRLAIFLEWPNRGSDCPGCFASWEEGKYYTEAHSKLREKYEDMMENHRTGLLGLPEQICHP